MAMLRIRSRDGLERVKTEDPNISIFNLKHIIESQLRVPVTAQSLSTNQSILLAKTLDDIAKFTDMSDPNASISTLGIVHGSIIYLAYERQRFIAGPNYNPAGSFGRKMTVDDLIAKQMRVTRQENPHCEIISFDRDAANVFQQYVSETLSFGVKRGGLMYGTVSPEGKVEVDFIYEPPQQGTETNLILLRDPDEEILVDAIAVGMGMRKVGFIFTQTVSQGKKDYTMSNLEILQAVEIQSESELKEWVTAVVKLEVNDDGVPVVHFEAFQLSDVCIRLFKEDWFDREVVYDDVDPKLSRMKKDVVIGVKDTKEVDNDFFLVVVKIADHEGPLSSSSGFPVENRMNNGNGVSMWALKNHLDRNGNQSFVRRISNFHVLLLIGRFLDLNGDIPALAECVHLQTSIPEGYQILIESLATSA